MKLNIVIALTLSVYQGFISMGFQLVGARLLYPYFGSSIIVWAFLISTFLAAFSTGSIVGGFLTKLSPRLKNRSIFALVLSCVLGFAFPAFFGKEFLIYIADNISSVELGLLMVNPVLFFVPIMALSTFPPFIADALDKNVFSTGMASGIIYGFSTIGNISGVMGTVFILIPSFAVSSIIIWWLMSFVLLGILLIPFLTEKGAL